MPFAFNPFTGGFDYYRLGVGATTPTSQVSDEAYGAGWDGVTDFAPSKNAVYDIIETLSGAGIADGDKGDITVSGSGATWTIDNEAVTLAKMANMATASLIYRKTAGAGAPEVNSLATLKTDLGLTGTNSGDQTSIVGITGTKAEFDTAVTDGNFLFVGDITQYTDELAQDAVGAMIDTTLVYTDGTPLLSRAALTGAITASAGSNTTALGSFTKSQLDTAVSDGNVLYVGDVTQYTDALARAAISETITGIAYDNSTGVFSLTAGYVIPTTTEETNWNTAYGWGNHASAGYFVKASDDGMDVTLGTPTDGDYSTGISGFTTSTKVSDAIDVLDETLSYLAPADAGALTGALTMSGTTKYSGNLSAGNAGYKTGEGAGTAVAYIISDATFTLTTPSTSTIFNKADEGYTRWHKATGTSAYSGTPEDSVDHAANFQEVNRSGTQSNTPWTDSQLSVTSVLWYNSFPKWQKGNAVLTITAAQLAQGYNRMKVTREGGFTTQSSDDYEVFYDDSSVTITVATPTIAEATPVTVYRSGVKYYGSGSTFTVSCSSIANISKNVYATTIATLTARDGASSSSWINSTNVAYNDATVSGLSSPPAITDSAAAITSKSITTVASQRAANGRIRVSSNHPWRSAVTADTASANRLIEGYANDATGTSSDTSEPFDDEHYRMLSNFNVDSTSYSSGTAGGWDSTVSLVSGTAGYDGLETSQGTIKYPVTNYGSGYLPSSGQPNYSAASGNRVYIRYFYVGAGKQNFTWTVSGTSATPVSVATGPSSNNLTFEMLAPATTKDGGGTTEWKDMYTAYTDDASDGCYVSGTRSSSTSNWITTLGTKSTSTSGNVICIRITAAAAWSGNLASISVSAS